MGKLDWQERNKNGMNSITKRQSKEKQKVVEMLGKTPIVHIVCEKTGISRATYYRWRKADELFEKETDEALENGKSLINDLAESQLISAIRERDLTAVIFWLKHHHKDYSTRVELLGNVQHEYKLTEEQEQLIVKALEMISKGGKGAD